MLARYGEKGIHELATRAGRKGGLAVTPNKKHSGFGSSHELAVRAGTKGGCISSREDGKPSLDERRARYAFRAMAGLVNVKQVEKPAEKVEVKIK